MLHPQTAINWADLAAGRVENRSIRADRPERLDGPTTGPVLPPVRPPSAGLRRVTGAPPVRRRVQPPRPKVTMTDFDGTHMGIGVSLWRASVTGDAAARGAVVETIPAPVALHSATEIVIGMLLLCLDQAPDQTPERAPGGGMPSAPDPYDVADLFVSEHPMTLARRRFVHEIAQTLADDRRGSACLVTNISVDDVVAVVVELAEHIERHFGYSVEHQIRSHVEHLHRLSAA